MYIGQPLHAGNLAVQTGTGNNTTTPIGSLNYSVGSSESLQVTLDGVDQIPGTDFTASGTSISFTSAVPTGVAIKIRFLALPISLPTPGDGTVDETKLKDALIGDFTDATVTASDTFLHGDASDSGNTKRDTIQGILDLASGGVKLIGTQTASSSASLTQTGLDSTYDCYMVVISDIVPATDGANPRLRFGNSGGIISTSNTYSYHVGRQWDNSGSPYAGVQARNTQDMIILGHTTGSASGEGFHAVLYIYGNQGGTTKPMVMFNSMQLDDNGHMGFNSGSGNHDNAITLDRFQIYMSSGNIASGTMRTYGISHT